MYINYNVVISKHLKDTDFKHLYIGIVYTYFILGNQLL